MDSAKQLKVNRVSCPSLIRRFPDPQGEFPLADESELVAVGRSEHI